ncbi:hypothetical protein Tco_0118096 [Tanacetum coccineum]
MSVSITEGPYYTDLPTPDEIYQLIRFKRVDSNRTIKNKPITLTPNQVLTKEVREDLKRWEELIRENVFSLGGHRDHLSACLSHIIVYSRPVTPSNLHHFGSSSHQEDDDNNEGTSRSSTSSPNSYINSLSSLAHQTYNIPTSFATAKAKTVNGEVQIQVLVDGKKVIVTETSVRRALQLKDVEEPITDEAANEAHVPTHSNDPLFSEITKLKERVKKLERRKSRTPGLRRLRKGRNNDNLMFDTRVFDGHEVEVEKAVSTVEVTTLAARLQAQEQEELTIEERSKMFVELMDKRKKHFARHRAEEQRRKPPTKAQKRTITRVNMFVDMDIELVKESLKKAEMEQESSSKRAGEELESDNSKKQKLDESVEVEVDDEPEMKKHI